MNIALVTSNGSKHKSFKILVTLKINGHEVKVESIEPVCQADSSSRRRVVSSLF
jgi:hypothetical protein